MQADPRHAQSQGQVLVTGGAGFIGSNVVAALGERGTPVAVCDWLGTGDKWHNLAKAELTDLVPPEALRPWLDAHATEVGAIVHMGAVSATDAIDGDLVIATNFGLSWWLWQWCARHGKRFIYASSAATYGDGAEGYGDDASPTALARLRPLNLYGWSKHLFDRRVARVASEGGPCPAQWAGLKFFNVYGPNEYHKGNMQSVLAKAYAVAAGGGTVELFKSHRADIADGEQRRDFVYVGDCVAVVLWLLDHPDVNGIFNVGTGQARTFTDLIHALFNALSEPARIAFRDMPTALQARYQYFTEARIEHLRTAGFARAFLTIEEGALRYVDRFLSRPDPYR